MIPYIFSYSAQTHCPFSHSSPLDNQCYLQLSLYTDIKDRVTAHIFTKVASIIWNTFFLQFAFLILQCSSKQWHLSWVVWVGLGEGAQNAGSQWGW